MVKPAGGRERPEPAKSSTRARFLQQRDWDMGRGRRRTPGEA